MPEAFYCTDEEVQAALPEYDPATQFDQMEALRISVSREIDAELGRPPQGGVEWFPTATGTASPREHEGTGTAYLAIDVYQGAAIVESDIAMEDDRAVPEFRERGGYLIAKRGIWPDGVIVTITKDWGWPEEPDGRSTIPGDVVRIAIDLCVARWRQRVADRELGGDVGKSFDLPPDAARKLEQLKARVAIRGVAA